MNSVKESMTKSIREEKALILSLQDERDFTQLTWIIVVLSLSCSLTHPSPCFAVLSCQTTLAFFPFVHCPVLSCSLKLQGLCTCSCLSTDSLSFSLYLLNPTHPHTSAQAFFKFRFYWNSHPTVKQPPLSNSNKKYFH